MRNWTVDECPDASGFSTIRYADGGEMPHSGHGRRRKAEAIIKRKKAKAKK